MSMISILALVVGLLGMFGLWALAWQLWMQALATEPTPTANSSRTSSDWRNEPTPERSTTPGSPPPRPAFTPPDEATEIEEAPVMRTHLSSNANTAFFNRNDLAGLPGFVEPNVEKTEILHEDDILEEPTLCKEKPPPDTLPKVPSRKTKFFPGPPRPDRN